MKTTCFHVVLDPDGMMDLDARNLAPVLGLDPYSAGQLVRGGHPRVVYTVDDEEAARLVCEAVGETGLVSYVCTDEQLIMGYSPLRMHDVTLEADNWVFHTRPGEELAVDPTRLRLIVEGRWITRQVTERATRPSKVKRLLMARTRHESTIDWQIENFLHLFTEDPQLVLEISSHDFDYTGLGEEKEYAAVINFRTLTERLLCASPQTPYDDRLAMRPPDAVHTNVSEDSKQNRRQRTHTEHEDNKRAIRQLCTLIYLNHQRHWNDPSLAC